MPNINPNIIETIIDDGGDGSLNSFTLTYSGTIPSLDLLETDYGSVSGYLRNGNFNFSPTSSFGKVVVSLDNNASETFICVHEVQIFVDNKKYLQMYGAYSQKKATKNATLDIPLYYTTDTAGWYIDSINQNVNFTTAGAKSVRVVIHYSSDFVSYDDEQYKTIYLGTLNVYAPEIDSIAVATRSNHSTTFVEAETEDEETFISHIKQGLVIDGYYKFVTNNLSAYSKEIIGYSLSASSGSLGTRAVTVSYNNKTTQYDIVVGENVYIAMSTNLSTLLIALSSYVGAVLDFTSLSISVTVASGGGSSITQSLSYNSSGVTIRVDGNVTTASSYTFNSSGNHTVTVSFSNLFDTGSKTIYDIVLASVSASADSSFSLSYIEGQRIDTTGLTVTLTYNNGDTETADNDLIEFVDDDEDGELLGVLSTDDDDKYVYVRYQGITDTTSLGQLEVVAKTATDIEVTETNFDDKFTFGDKFTDRVPQGIKVVLHYDNGTSETLQNSDLTFTIGGNAIPETFEPDENLTPSTQVYGNMTVTVTYGLLTDTFTIKLVKPTLSHILISGYADDYKNGDAFSYDGTVVAIYANGWTYDIDTTDNTIFQIDASTSIPIVNGVIDVKDANNVYHYGTKLITITVNDPFDTTKTAEKSYQISVASNGAIVSAIFQFDESVEYNKYFVGDTYNAKGVSVLLTDVDGNIMSSNVFTTSLAKGTLLRKGQSIDVTLQYVLSDGTVLATDKYTVLVSIPTTVNLTKTRKYQVAIGDMNGNLFDKLTYDNVEIKLGKQYETYLDENNVTKQRLIGEYYPVFDEDYVGVDTTAAHTDTYGFNIYSKSSSNANDDWVGYMDMGLTAEDGTVIRNAHLVLFEDPINPIDGDGNIEVKFPHYVSGYADRINKCKFGMVYNNRLFVAGNPNYKNCDWHSGDVNASQVENYNNKSILDYTYFSDLDYCYYGNDDTAIVGYDIYRDGDLIVVKEGSRHQATLYRRTVKLVSAMSSDGNLIGSDLGEQAFPMFDINSNGGVGGLSFRSITNFVGETLVLTKDGLKAITNKDDVYNTSKYSFDVSSFINYMIKREKLKDAFIYTYKEKILLKTNRGLYVGVYELRNENNEYEWFFLDGIKADIFFEFDDELYFANDNGELYRFPELTKDYKDKARTYIGVGGVTLKSTTLESNDKDALVVSQTYKNKIIEGKPFKVLAEYTDNGVRLTSLLYASLGEFINKNTRDNSIINLVGFDLTKYNGTFVDDTIAIVPYSTATTINYDKLYDIQDNYYDGRIVYFDKIVGNPTVNSIQVNVPYKLVRSDELVTNIYKLYDTAGNQVYFSGIDTFRMCFLVNSDETRIYDVKDYNSTKEFKLLGDHNQILDLVNYNGVVGSYSGVITEEKAVESYFITAPYTLNKSISTLKTIWQWTIANDTNFASYLDVAYLYSRKQGDYDIAINSEAGTRQSDFNQFNFYKVQFSSDKLPHIYTKYKTIASVGFIRFMFRNYEATNMVLSSLEVVYTVSQFTKGVK